MDKKQIREKCELSEEELERLSKFFSILIDIDKRNKDKEEKTAKETEEKNE